MDRAAQPLFHRIATIVAIAALGTGLSATRAQAESLPPVSAISRAMLTPDRGGDPQVATLWRDSVDTELAGELRDAAELRRRILDLDPNQVHAGWRLARDLMAIGEGLPEEAKEDRLRVFREAQQAARHARQVDATCPECCFYDFASTSRLATTVGVYQSVGMVREAGSILNECLEMPAPGWSDAEWNHERANLYYGAAVYFRMLPDAWWARKMFGQRGDRRRAALFARRAVEIASSRVDYRVELGVALVCLGEAEDDAAARAEGLIWLQGLESFPDRLDSDPIDRKRAEDVKRDPSSACGNARALKVQAL